MTRAARVLALVAAGVAFVPAGRSPAATADGVTITNMASYTYMTTLGVGVSVSYGATVLAVVMNPCLMVKKAVFPAMRSSGGTLTFRITLSNCSSLTSSFNVTATESMPENTAFVAGADNFCNAPPGGTITTAWSTDGGTNWTSGSYPAMGQGTPVKLRWSVNRLGPRASGLVTYTASVL